MEVVGPGCGVDAANRAFWPIPIPSENLECPAKMSDPSVRSKCPTRLPGYNVGATKCSFLVHPEVPSLRWRFGGAMGGRKSTVDRRQLTVKAFLILTVNDRLWTMNCVPTVNCKLWVVNSSGSRQLTVRSGGFTRHFAGALRDAPSFPVPRARVEGGSRTAPTTRSDTAPAPIPSPPHLFSPTPNPKSLTPVFQ
jgi:hypothetical protein